MKLKYYSDNLSFSSPLSSLPSLTLSPSSPSSSTFSSPSSPTASSSSPSSPPSMYPPIKTSSHNNKHTDNTHKIMRRFCFPSFFITIVVFLFICQSVDSSRRIWWNLAFKKLDLRSERRHLEFGQLMDDAGHTDLINCRSLRDLSQVQKKICQSHTDHLPVVSKGLKISMQECKYQFKNRRWNCSMENGKHVLQRKMHQGSKEMGFMYSLMSASVIHSVARACKNGELKNCGCSSKKRPRSLPRDWLWQGCGDNTAYGYKFSVGFADAVEREKNHPRKSKELARRLMNLHNNEAGRRAVYAYSKPACKCHGVSGSCNLKTCWHQLPSFRETGYRLRDRFDKASEVRFNKQGTSLKQRFKRSPKPSKEDIIYLTRSPSYCVASKKNGYSGTQGRQCSLTSKGTDSCEHLCCGRGWKTRRVVKTEKCFCKFQYCCYVKCKTCEVKMDVTTCN